jgi:hypothetical protein
MKKAQITLFVIIGLIFVLIFAYVFYLSRFDYELTVGQNTGFKQYFKPCLDSKIEQGIYQMGLYSGHLSKPTRFELSTIENSKAELQTYIENNIKFCTATYPNIENIKITNPTPNIDIQIFDKIIIKIQDPYSYKLDNEQVTSPDLLYTYDVRYQTTFNTATEIINQNGNYILDSLDLKQNELLIETGSVYDGELWVIKDKKSRIKSGSFYFAFKMTN